MNDEKGFVITSVATNPVQHDNATITLSAAKKGSVNFKVYDIEGNIVKQWQANIAAGNNNILMNVAALASGTYHVLAFTIDSRATFRFIKQ